MAPLVTLDPRTWHLKPINFVHHFDSRNLKGPDILDDTFDLIDGFQHLGVAGINDVQQQIRFYRFIEGRLEGRHQFVRQVPHKPNRIRQHDMLVRPQSVAFEGWIEGRKQLIRRVNPSARQCINQRRFTGIGVTDQTHH